jgi:hypothetical protein
LDTKARSKPMTTILDNLMSFQEFDVKIFGDKVILDEEIGKRLGFIKFIGLFAIF